METEKLPFYFNADDWFLINGFNTTGTRNKCVLINPKDNQSYYFKTSIKKGKKDYPFEFWSEIVASVLGQHLNLPVLKYDLASFNGKMGCLCKNMIEHQKEELIEGVNLIIQTEPDFREYCKNNHHINKIETALASVGLIEYKRIVVEMILFDCIIGNTDRHSENWALIRNKAVEQTYSKLKKLFFISRWRRYWKLHKQTGIPFWEVRKLVVKRRHKFAPFYDNGSSLGRELSENRIGLLLSNEEEFYKYFFGGKSDIIVGSEKSSFTETIDCLLSQYPEECTHFISKHLALYNNNDFSSLIKNIDYYYPPSCFEESRISQNRKVFITKLIDERINYIYESIKHHSEI